MIGYTYPMMYNDWIARELVAQRAAADRAASTDGRVSETRRRTCSPGPVAVRAGRALVAIGWRLGGTASLPPTVRRRLV